MIGVSRHHTIIMCSGSNVTAYLHLRDASCTRFYRLCPQTLPVSVQGKGRVQTRLVATVGTSEWSREAPKAATRY